ncbi:MAG TPA: M20/M25/M40 family metallo-hydrolase [Candidatus Angelobacter sp.]|nr:M20/M25/M40 family metallo-hydrolase [Candidatus Angelobacter sp.]
MLTLKRVISSLAVLSLAVALNCSAQEKVDLDMIGKIRYEGFRNSKIMEIASGLMDQIGQRLTGSPNVKRANEWTRDKLKEFGLVNSHLEPWTPFGRGWANEYTNVRMVSPDIATLIAYAKAWTPGTEGVVRGKVMRVNIRGPQDLAKYRGKLAGKILLIGDDPEVKPSVEPLSERLNEKSLADIEHYQIPSERNNQLFAQFAQRARIQRQINKFLDDEKPLAIIDHSRGAIGGGTVFVQQGGSYKTGQTVGTPQITVATEHWTRIARILADKKEVELELNVKNNFYDSPDAMTQNDTIAEIPGADKKDEVVMLGAHLDSWHAGTGATDNGAGTIVMMEAVRILKALDIKPRRTIRIGLWTGEEQGLLGSQWYVAHHFGSRPESKDPERKGDPTVIRREAGPVTTKPEQAKVSVYFNVDNGTGKIRGVYLQENAAVEPIFEAWMKPFHDLGMDTLTMRNTGGTDHLSFDAVGIPGFQFIQDPIEYDTRTHHSNMDVYDRLQPEDLKQMAVIVASFVYMAAQRDQMFPRKPIEKELPPPPPAEDEENPPSPVTNPAAADRPQQPKPAEQRPTEQRPPQAQPTPRPRLQ